MGGSNERMAEQNKQKRLISLDNINYNNVYKSLKSICRIVTNERFIAGFLIKLYRNNKE